MLKWIRWSGLIGFSVISALIVCFWLFAAGPLIKMAIEKFGSDAVGAQVNVADVSLGFNPLSLTITGVQVADKDAPMENMVSFDKAVANLEPFPLLLGKAIIPDVTLQGVALGSARSVSGALQKAPEQAKETQSKENETTPTAKAAETETAASSLPSAEDILARETLLTEQRGKAFETSLKQHQTKIDDAIANLPNEKALKEYETRLNAIIKGKFKSVDDFKQRKQALDDLREQFKQDKQAIANAKLAIKEGKSDLSKQWIGLKSAPKEDLANLKGKYTLDGAGASNMAALLFGDDAGGYAQTTLEYYEKIRPLIVDDEAKAEKQALKDKRLEGRFIHYATDRPLPDFWIKQLSFTMSLPKIADQPSLGEVAVKVVDITHQQVVINKPTRLWATGQNLKNMQSLQITGELDHRTTPGKDVFDLQIEDWQLSKVKLGLAGLNLMSSRTYVQAGVQFSEGKLDMTSTTLFKQTQFDSKERTTLAREMVLALANVERFTIEANAKGKVTDPKVSLKTDLDNQLKSAFNDRIDQKQKELEAKLAKKLNDKLLSYAGGYEDQLKQLNLTEGSLGDKGKALEKLAKSEIGNYQDQLKAEAKAKADKEKAQAKAKAKAEQEKAKAKAKAEADKKQKELEEKAKEKLKKLF